MINTDLCSEPNGGGSVKEALYRIAQGALHNTVKHTKASEIRLWLECVDGQIILQVRDNGARFDPNGALPGHLGLHSMRERGVNCAGTLAVESASGVGTRRCVHVPLHSGDTP